MEITGANLALLHQGYNAAFREGLLGRVAEAQWERIAMRASSTTREEHYAWLRNVAGLRRWLGDRTMRQLVRAKYSIENEDWEETIVVDRNDIEDDQYGVYGTRFRLMGEAAAAHPDELLWDLLGKGFGDDAGFCYDGQFFFDTDHPYLDADGVAKSQANTDGGGGPAWYLMDSKRAYKPLIYQVRKPIGDIVMMTDPHDEGVFSRKEFRYGIDSRDAAGFGFYQCIWGSKQQLDAAHYRTAREKLAGMMRDGGDPLGVMPNTLIVPPSLESAGRKLVVNQLAANGESNEWAGTAEVVVVPWLA